ncbi:tetratricopeptide repeat protein [candidate division WOR-3 bacterium]|nr:tetratricopeptide repeat protein [candidate division WOR-3 bacterium]
MTMHDRKRLCVTCAILLILVWTAVWANDFAVAEQAFEQGLYTIAEVYFRAVLVDQAYRPYAPDAAFYLTRIYANQNEFLPFVNAVNVFLATYDFDERCPHVLSDLLERLCAHGAYRLAYEYATRYNYLLDNDEVLCRIGHGMFEQHDTLWAARVFSQCPIEDTILILQAALSSDKEEKISLFEQVKGIKGIVHTIELLLETGDTISAYDAYCSIDTAVYDPELLCRYAKASLLFDIPKMDAACKHLQTISGYEKKTAYFEALAHGTRERLIIPDNEEECRLFITCLALPALDSDLPEGIDLDSILHGSISLEELDSIRSAFPGIYLIDSIYCEALVREGKVHEAFNVIEPYLGYAQTYHYARCVRGLERYSKKDYAGAVQDILLSQNQGPRAQYALAQANTYLGRDPLKAYEAVLSAHLDSTFRVQVQKEMIKLYFQKGMYAEVVALPNDITAGNDTLQKYYMYSLAHLGNVKKADSLALATFGSIDHVQADHYGAYLLANKAYRTARFLYDSLWSTASPLPPAMYYTWALVPMLQGDIDTALARFKEFIRHGTPDRPYYLSMFKSATIHYLREEFDSAAYYYGEAGKDDSLKLDALQNQLICYKKGAEWKGVIDVAENLLPLLQGETAAEVYFEYGYAQLRYGDFRGAITNFQQALQRVSNPEYFFWLGETYLAKGDFVEALYQYRKIAHLFPADEMWTPTAWYKIGITLEFMEQLDEARKVYQDIIKKRGAADTWGVEAQKRLDLMD